MRGRTPVVALGLAVAGLALWRAACVLAGPDVDTDAYAHHMIARAILADPRDLAVHWVWLPLFHYLQVPLVALGGTMNAVRWVNVALSAAVPIALFFYVRGTTGRATPETTTGRAAPETTTGRAAPETTTGRAAPETTTGRAAPETTTGRAAPGRATSSSAPPMSADATALVAALLAAACPIAMQMGTTAQSEPLFALLALGIAIAYERRRYGVTAAMLGAAVLLRYEGWAIFATVAALTAAETVLARMRRRPSGRAAEPGRPRSKRGSSPAAAWVAVLVPAALILAWAALRRPVDGRWFGFLGQTHEFASQAVVDGGRARGVIGLARDALYYPLYVAVRVLGPAVALAPFGVARTWRDQGARFVLVLAACLGFVSLTWVNRSSLGLDRHFVSVVPLYAVFAAQGVAAIAERVQRWAGSAASERTAWGAPRALAAALSIGSLAVLAMMLTVWMTFWRAAIDRGWPERAALGAYLRSLPQAGTIFCDDATLEILSGLDRRRFDRHWVDDPHTWDLIGAAAQADGVTYVATWRRKLIAHESAGPLVFRATDAPADESSGVAVMRVLPDANRVAR